MGAHLILAFVFLALCESRGVTVQLTRSLPAAVQLLFRWCGPLLLGTQAKSVAQGAATLVLCAIGHPMAVPGSYHADCAAAKAPHPMADDADLAAKLWRASEEYSKGF